MSLFCPDASIRGEPSASRKLADAAEQAWRQVHPDGVVVRRDLVATPIAVDVWPQAVGGSFTPEENRTPEQRDALRVATELADELVTADSYLFAVPLYNWGISQHVKAWIALVLTDPRPASGGPQAIAGRPASLIVTRGAGYGEGSPRHGWDHATPYYQRVFGEVLALDVHLNEVELTLAEVNPAMAALREQAKVLWGAGLASADAHGKLLTVQSAA